jgi:hypothetical protein
MHYFLKSKLKTKELGLAPDLIKQWLTRGPIFKKKHLMGWIVHRTPHVS